MENEKVDRDGDYNGENDEHEDQKVEEFFALIRSFKEARNRRKDESFEDNERKKKLRRLNEAHPSWVPSFELEDFKFNDEIQFRRLPLICPRPRNQKEDKKQQDEDDGLDLNLSL
ncbi:protein NIM1-INTERACTING 1 [Manihot esculenta]|uniref:Uncharacterized protein n=1 Tax=Manihot esculenta TaxID=3983 RepID=A0A2C9WNV7_MANES|nr:protein NIM1-INTERACTING 1 [Manihot esculenta]OAY61975.1 hypothetical protein MANES_01G232100v8 [Manihot esculenta]